MFFRRDLPRNLTAAEGDANLDELLQRIDAAAAMGQQFRTTAVGFTNEAYVQSFQNGDQFSVSVPWPIPTFIGEWQPNTLYPLLVMLSADGHGVYVVVIAHTSAATFDENATDPISGNPLYKKLFPTSAKEYIPSFSWPGLFTVPNQNIAFHPFSTAVTYPANFGAYDRFSTHASGSVAAAGSFSVDVAKAVAADITTFSSVGTISFAAGSASATFSTSSGAAINFLAGDKMRLRGPATPDVAFADFDCALVGFMTPLTP